jgi:hypothetical protein
MRRKELRFTIIIIIMIINFHTHTNYLAQIKNQELVSRILDNG